MTNKVPNIRFKGFTDDWEQRKLGEVADKTYGGGTPKTSIEEYWQGNIPWIQSQDLSENKVFGVEPRKYINQKAIENSATKIIPKNSIAIITRVGVGKLALMPISYCTSQDFLSLSSLKINELYATYVIYKMLQIEKEKVQGTSIKGITSAELLSKKIDVPIKYAEQQKVGEYFSNLDHLITLHQRKCEQTKELKKFMLQKMFPKKGEKNPEIRFSGFTDDWEQRKLGEITERVQGNDGRMDLPTLTISAANGWMDQKERFSGNIAGKEQKNYTLLHKGELSYNHGNSKLAKYGAVFSLETYEEALVPRVYHSFKVINGSPKFIEYYFATKIPDRELAKLVSSGARMDGLLNINFNEFMGINLTVPNKSEQEKISNYFSNLDRLITLHQRKCEQLKELKKFMLQNMFPKKG
ncbi:restriction endonuclease subunit S [Streptococcus lutetiensis]|uniref:restriction endonuclease subunit S n=1 Tax=Streptococcus lutetiensis TaxID=150055 RepID=UPI003DA4DE30